MFIYITFRENRMAVCTYELLNNYLSSIICSNVFVTREL